MAKAVIRGEKGKGLNEVSGSSRHNKRDLVKDWIDVDRMELNEDLTPEIREDIGETTTTAQEVTDRLADRLEAIQERGNVVRSNSVTHHDWILTASPEFFRGTENGPGEWRDDRLEEWRERTVEFLREEFGDNLIDAEIHLDEDTPHIHAVTIPETEDGRLCAKELFDPERMEGIQDRYADSFGDLELVERGKPDSDATHIPNKEIQKLKKQRDEYRVERDHLRERVQELEMNQLKNQAEHLRNLPESIMAKFLEDPDPQKNAIDQVMDQHGLNFAEATVFLLENDDVQRFLSQDQSMVNRSHPVYDQVKEKIQEDTGLIGGLVREVKKWMNLGTRPLWQTVADELGVSDDVRQSLRTYQDEHGENRLRERLREIVDPQDLVADDTADISVDPR